MFGAPHAMRIWLNPQRLAAFCADAERRGHARSRTRIPRSPRARSAACRTARADAQRDRHRAVAAADARAVRADHPQDPAERLDRAAEATSRGSSSASENYNAIGRVNRPSRRRASPSRSRPGADALKTAELVKARGRPSWRRIFPDGLQLRLRQRHHRFHQAVGRRGGEDAVRGDRPRRDRDVRVPAELARDADPGDRRAGGAARHLRGVLARRLHASTR